MMASTAMEPGLNDGTPGGRLDDQFWRRERAQVDDLRQARAAPVKLQLSAGRKTQRDRLRYPRAGRIKR
jgi:hypothetical protein